VLYLLPFVVILVTLFFHNCSFSKSVRLLSILFLVTVCFLPSLANKRRHNEIHVDKKITGKIKAIKLR